MRMVLCDDEVTMLEIGRGIIEKTFADYEIEIEIKTYSNPELALEQCKKQVVDFVILDIDMPKMSGFELAGKLQELPAGKRPLLLFMSSKEHFVYDAFKYQPFDFIRKSCMEEDVKEKIGRLIRECAYNRVRLELVRGEDACVYLSEVLYFKSDRNHLEAYTKDGSYRCKETLNRMAEKYRNCLIQTDKQHLVNVHSIQKILINDIVLKEGKRIPLSRRRRKIVEEEYMRMKRV